jgi:hypothetical protein
LLRGDRDRRASQPQLLKVIVLFLSFERPAAPEMRLSAAESDRFDSILRSTPGLARALIHTPEITTDPYIKREPSPLLVAQLYFAEIEGLEAAAARAAPLQALASANDLPGLIGAEATQQAMLARIYSVPGAHRSMMSACTYLVAYEGRAEQPGVWLAHYLDHHVPLMTRLPAVRDVEVYTRLDWCGFLPWRRVDHIQRNKVVFDDAAALTAALNSPVRHDMRADFAGFPPFFGRTAHHAFRTRTVVETAGFRRE